MRVRAAPRPAHAMDRTRVCAGDVRESDARGAHRPRYLHGKPATPQSTPETAAAARDAIAAACASAGADADEEAKWDAAVAALCRAGDATSGARLARNDYYRLSRAMEIVMATGGVPKGDFRAPDKLSAGNALPAGESHASDGMVNASAALAAALDCEVHSFAVSVRPRQALYRGIDARVEDMVSGGLLEEAAWLLDAGATAGSCCGARAIGYKEAIELLDSSGPESGEDAGVTADRVRACVTDIQRATRNFAKRQLTWLRNDATFEWLDAATGTAAMADAIEARVLHGKPLYGDEGSDASGDVWNGALTKEEERAMRRYTGELSAFAEGSGKAEAAARWVDEWARGRAAREREAAHE